MRAAPAFARAFRPLYGKPCWNVRGGWGSFLTFEFGEPHLEVREPSRVTSKSKAVRDNFARRIVTMRGDWHLWIYCCDWTAYAGRKRIVSTADSHPDIEKAARLLDGQKLTGVHLGHRGCRTTFEFDLGGRLVTRPYDDSEQWFLYEPDGRVLTLRADKRFAHAPGTTAAAAEKWRPAWVRG